MPPVLLGNSDYYIERNAVPVDRQYLVIPEIPPELICGREGGSKVPWHGFLIVARDILARRKRGHLPWVRGGFSEEKRLFVLSG
jgi:hypothetical protein